MLREKYSKKIEENESEKLNKLLITDYAEVKNKEQKPWQPHASHDSYTFQAFKRTRIQVFHDNNRDFKSRTLFVGGERCPVAVFEFFCGVETSIKTPMRWSVFFYLSSTERNRKFKTSGLN